MNTRKFFLITVLVELPVALLLLFAPVFIIKLLIGADLTSVTDLTLSRLFGAAVLSLCAICWMAFRRSDIQTARSVTAGMAVYNITVMILLICSALQYMTIPLLILAILVHATLGGVALFLLRKSW